MIRITNKVKKIDEVNYDIIVETKAEEQELPIYKYYSVVKINSSIEKSILFKFWDDEEFSIHYELIYIEESNFLFYRSCYEWGIIDISANKLMKQALTFQPGIIERIQNSIIVDDELEVESYSLYGKLIDKKPIDPPSERVATKNGLIYTSPVLGEQKLMLE